ncbi:MAG: hypothetical protein VBE63_29245 [Lamprobacter sp.]|nr:hypothetical protein [Lamprobacter sp.]MEA3643977.1 hypothetical protein [Lamprobacter sp.]
MPTGRFVSNWGKITLAPEDTGLFHSNPCRVFPPKPRSTRLRRALLSAGVLKTATSEAKPKHSDAD